MERHDKVRAFLLSSRFVLLPGLPTLCMREFPANMMRFGEMDIENRRMP